jgi:hypothetical protein
MNTYVRSKTVTDDLELIVRAVVVVVLSLNAESSHARDFGLEGLYRRQLDCW